MIKTCKRCGVAKEMSSDFFYAHPQAKDGFHSWCKPCHKEWRDENKERRIAQMKAWAQRNEEYVKQQQKDYYEANKDHRKQYSLNRSKLLSKDPVELQKRSDYGKKWREENPNKNRAKSNKRRADKDQRVPCWYNEFDAFVMQEAHDLAAMRDKTFGMKWHVDHIIPLAGKMVSGLHVANNVDVVPQSYNIAKSNKFDIALGAQRFIG